MAEELTTAIEETSPIETDITETTVEPSVDYSANEVASTSIETPDNIDDLYNDFIKPNNYFSSSDEFRTFISDPKNAKDFFKDAIAPEKLFSNEKEFIQFLGVQQPGKPSAVPSASVGGGSAMRGPLRAQPFTSQTKGVEGIIAGYGKPKMNQVGVEQPRKTSEAEQAVMGYGLPKNIKIGAGKANVEEDLRLPTEAEFATIEKMPLTKKAKLEEAVKLGTPPVERATKDIKSNKDKIISSEEELNKLEKELATYKQQSDSLLAAYNNEQLSPEERNQAGQEYNKVNEVAKPIEDRRNELYGNYQGYIDNQKVLFNELDKAEKMRQKGLEKEYSHLLNLTQSVGRDLVKTVTGMTRMGFTLNDLIPNFGLITPEEEEAGKKALFEGLEATNKFAEKLITQETPENYKKIFEGDFSLGKLAYITTNAVSSTAPTVAAGLLTGGIGSVAAGAGLGFEESKSIMKDAGLSDEQSDWAAMGLAIPIGLLEKYGADDVVRLLNGSGIRKQVASELAKKIAGKTLSREAIFLEAKKTFGEVIKSKTGKILKEGRNEALTEAAQGELQELTKQVVQEFTGVDKDENMSTQDYVMQQLMQRAEEAAGGFLGGTSMQGAGVAFNAALNKQEFSPSAYTKAMEFADPAKFQQFQNDLMLEVQNGVLTEEQANDAIANVQAIQETNALIPNSVQNLDLRTEAVNLIIEKNNIAQEIEGKDPDLIAPENARLAEIKKSLNEIALGNKPGAEEQQASPTQPSETTPTTEAQPTAEAAPQTLPEVTNLIATLREQEQAEYADIDPNDEAKRKQIYDRYDEIITPLLKQEKELKAAEAQAPVAEEGNIIHDSLKDIDSTANAITPEVIKSINNKGFFFPLTGDPARKLSEIYHEAKESGNSPELVKAVEEALIPQTQVEPKVDNKVVSEVDENIESESKELNNADRNKLEVNNFKEVDGMMLNPDGMRAWSKISKNIKKLLKKYGIHYIEGFVNFEHLKGGQTQHGNLVKLKNGQASGIRINVSSVGDKLNIENTILHELGHKVYEGLSIDQKKQLEREPVTEHGKEVKKYVEEGGSVYYKKEDIAEEDFAELFAEKKGDLKAIQESLSTQEPTPTSEQAPQSFPAQEGAIAEQEQAFKANPELEQIYRDLNAAVTKNVDKDTIRMLKANPTEAMVDKALRELQSKGVIKIDCK
jgi:hypothetical protein